MFYILLTLEPATRAGYIINTLFVREQFCCTIVKDFFIKLYSKLELRGDNTNSFS